MIVFGVLANTSIGDLFTSGFCPEYYSRPASLSIFTLSYWKPDFVFTRMNTRVEDRSTRRWSWSAN